MKANEFFSVFNCSVCKFDKVYEAALSRGVQFVITQIEGHDLDVIRRYHLKFKSQRDLDMFKGIVKG